MDRDDMQDDDDQFNMDINRAAGGVGTKQIQSFLEGATYPATKDELIQTAEQKGAGEDILEALGRVPGDRFDSPSELNEAIGKME